MVPGMVIKRGHGESNLHGWENPQCLMFQPATVDYRNVWQDTDTGIDTDTDYRKVWHV